MRQRKNGTLGSLFIGRSEIIPVGRWLHAKAIRTKGFAYRPGFHCCASPFDAPHLKRELASKEQRVWCLCAIQDWYTMPRPENQGGFWYIADLLKILAITNM